MGIVHNILFESLDNFEVTNPGSPGVSLTNGTVLLNTGSSAYTYAALARYMQFPTELYTWDKKRTFRILAIASIAEDPDLTAYIGFGGIGTFGKAIAFKFYPTKITGYWSDGSVITEVDLLTGLTAPWYMGMQLKIIFNPGENVKFYIDDILLATVDTDLPSDIADADRIFDACVYNSLDLQHRLQFCQLRFDQDL